MYRHGALNPRHEWQLDLDQVAVDAALKLVGEHIPDNETQTVLDSLDGTQVGYVYLDSSNNLRALPLQSERSAPSTVFVDDASPLATTNPPSRRRPQYIESANAIFVPVEAKASPAILGAILVHEAKHAIDLNDPEHAAEATGLPTIAPAEDLVSLLSEIKAFTMEAKLLENLLGPALAEYLQTEVDKTDKVAIDAQKEYGGLLLEAGIEPVHAKEALLRDLSFVNPGAEDFAMGILSVALPIAVMIRAVDQICDRNNAPDSVRTELKLHGMLDYYDLY